MNIKDQKPLIALLTNNDDDVYCFRKELIEELIANGYKILISCPDGPKFSLLKNIDFIHDKLIIDRRGSNPLKDIKLFAHYWNLFRKYKPKVVLTYTAKPNVYGTIVAKALGIPVINNVTGFGSALTTTSRLKKSLIIKLFKTAYRKSACIMFQNKTNMEYALSNGFVKGDYLLIPGSGVNLGRYPLQPYPAGGNGNDGETVVFNYIGRILKDKSVDDYINAAKYIKSKYHNTIFNILGFIEPTEKDYYEPLLNQLEKNDIISYKGSVSNVKPFIAKAHAIIHPSTYGEGMSNVLLENASSGRFIITTDTPGCKETVIDGETGFIYHGGDVNQLIKCIERFLALNNVVRKTMGYNGRRYVSQNFDRKKVVEAYIITIQKLLS